VCDHNQIELSGVNLAVRVLLSIHQNSTHVHRIFLSAVHTGRTLWEVQISILFALYEVNKTCSSRINTFQLRFNQYIFVFINSIIVIKTFSKCNTVKPRHTRSATLTYVLPIKFWEKEFPDMLFQFRTKLDKPPLWAHCHNLRYAVAVCCSWTSSKVIIRDNNKFWCVRK
jgi:hypothetical protein